MPKIYLTQAKRDVGLGELLAGIKEHQAFLSREGGENLRAARRERVRQEFLELMKEGIFFYVSALLAHDNRLEDILEDILDRRTDPYSASEALIAQTLRPDGPGR
jgi:LAO/AO transport system kinase